MADEVFVGIDWGSEVHTVCVLDETGQQLWRGEIKQRGDEIISFAEKVLLLAAGDASRVTAAMETTHGAVLEALLERGVRVYSINPKQLDRFRDRYSVAGAKDDPLDAFVLADTVRTDRALYRQVNLGEPDLVTLRELSRCYDTLTGDAQALGCQVQELLRRYHVALLGLGDWHANPWLWELFELAPTPQKARSVSRDDVQALIRKNHMRKSKVDEVLAAFRAPALPVAPGVAEGTSERLRYLLAVLRTIHEQKKACFKRLSALMRSPAAVTGSSEKAHRDATLLLSLPGVAERIGAAMLTEASTALQNRDYQALRQMCGTAPVSKRTGGKSKRGRSNPPQVSMRRACSLRLRNAVYHWGMGAIRRLPRCRAHYTQLRSMGHSHARAIRGIVDRLLKVLIAMLIADRPFDPTKWTLPAAASP